jgi:ATP-dependent Clp protease ATP-binding subunit ClpA
VRLPAELANLLDNARAQAKQAGHGRVQPLHLAVALYMKDPRRLEASVGATVHHQLDALMGAEPSTPGVAVEDAPETIALLERVAGAADVWTDLVAELVRDLPQLRSSDPAQAPPPVHNEPNTEHVRAQTRAPNLPDIDRLASALKKDVLGQDRAIAQVVSRLALTLRGMDIETKRPDGIFVFVGPASTGKRSLAASLARELFGSEGALISVDMHECREPASIARLIGPLLALGESEDGWLTSRVLLSPRSVILFDDAPQAHPHVWDSLVHVFDAGRLTDVRGKTAVFDSTILILTCHTDEEAGQSVGFVTSGSVKDSTNDRAGLFLNGLPQRIHDSIDEVVSFAPLSLETVESIAAVEVAKALDHASRYGYKLRVPEDVIVLLAGRGFSANDGVGHLRANLERFLLEPLAQHEAGDYVAVRIADEVSLVPA